MARRLVYYVACTLDGFIAHEDGSHGCFLWEGEHFRDLLEWFPETIPAHLRPALGVTGEPREFDTVLMGRATYEVGLREGITNPYQPLRQIVFSRTMGSSPDPGVELSREDPAVVVRRMKQENGRSIWLCGGGQMAAALFGEIDELILKVNPAVLGEGIPMFAGGVPWRRARLTFHKTYANGFVFARYDLTSQTPVRT